MNGYTRICVTLASLADALLVRHAIYGNRQTSADVSLERKDCVTRKKRAPTREVSVTPPMAWPAGVVSETKQEKGGRGDRVEK